MTPEYAEDLNADVIIAALGAKAARPQVPGIDSNNVLSAQEAYPLADKLGPKVVILGAGLVGIELGLHLIRYGKQVTILEMTDHMSDGGNFLHMLGLHTEIKKRGLKIFFHTRLYRSQTKGLPAGHRRATAFTRQTRLSMPPVRSR